MHACVHVCAQTARFQLSKHLVCDCGTDDDKVNGKVAENVACHHRQPVWPGAFKATTSAVQLWQLMTDVRSYVRACGECCFFPSITFAKLNLHFR